MSLYVSISILTITLILIYFIIKIFIPFKERKQKIVVIVIEILSGVVLLIIAIIISTDNNVQVLSKPDLRCKLIITDTTDKKIIFKVIISNVGDSPAKNINIIYKLAEFSSFENKTLNEVIPSNGSITIDYSNFVQPNYNLKEINVLKITLKVIYADTSSIPKCYSFTSNFNIPKISIKIGDYEPTSYSINENESASWSDIRNNFSNLESKEGTIMFVIIEENVVSPYIDTIAYSKSKLITYNGYTRLLTAMYKNEQGKLIKVEQYVPFNSKKEWIGTFLWDSIGIELIVDSTISKQSF